jgi:hypothetical protein
VNGDAVGDINIDIGAFERQVESQVPGMFGDYNEDQFTDAADYVVWRKFLGPSLVTPFSFGDGSGEGIVGPEDHEVWIAHYGLTFTTEPTLQLNQSASESSNSAQTDSSITELAFMDLYRPVEPGTKSPAYVPVRQSIAVSSSRTAAVMTWPDRLPLGVHPHDADPTSSRTSDRSTVGGSDNSLSDTLDEAFAFMDN